MGGAIGEALYATLLRKSRILFFLVGQETYQ